METAENNKSLDFPLEYQVFASVFRDHGAVTYFNENLPAEAVGLTTGQTGVHQFYLSVLDCFKKTKEDPIDPIIFRSWLEQDTDLYEALGGPAVLDAFMETVLSCELARPEAIASVLKYRYKKRIQLDMLQELRDLITKKGTKSEEDDDRVNYLTDQIRSLENDLDYSPLDYVTTGQEIAEGADRLWELPDFLPTQFKKLNRAMGYDEEKGGFCRGAVHAIIAQSGQGKSTLAKCLANHWLDTGYTVLFVNYEEAPTHWERTLFSQIVQHNVYLGMDNPEEKARMTQKFISRLKDWGKRMMVRHDPDTPYFDDLEQWIRDIRGHNENVPDVIIIDTIQSMFMRGGGNKPRWGQFEEMMVRLEKLARDMHCVLIITAQENSNRMKENREVVKQSDTGGSITIQQKCAVTIFITQKRLNSGDDSDEDEIMELQIPKNRITGSAFATDPALVRYNDATKSYEPFDIIDVQQYQDPENSFYDIDELINGDIHY